MAAAKEAAAQELCPRCHDGVLYRITDREDSYGVQCAQCQYHESRLKEGFEVKHPGDPITKIEDDNGAKGGDK